MRIRYSISALLLLLALSFQACKQEGNGQDKDKTFGSTDAGKRIDALTKKIDEKPDDAALRIERAKAYEATDQLEPAIRDVEQAIILDTANASYYFYIAKLYEKRPYVKGTIESYEKVTQLDKNNKEAFLNLGKLYFQVKNREKSFQNLNAALRLDPRLAEAFFYRGYNYRELNFPDKAIENFEKAIELNPSYYEAFLQLGLLYADKKDPRAESYYSTALRLKPGSVPALYGRGMYYQEADSNRLAMQDYRAILNQDPDNRSANYNLGYNFYLLKQYDSAAVYFGKAINADPAYEEAYYGRGLSYRALGRYAEAESDFRRSEMLKEEAGKSTGIRKSRNSKEVFKQ